jgi:hypothetical protein
MMRYQKTIGLRGVDLKPLVMCQKLFNPEQWTGPHSRLSIDTTPADGLKVQSLFGA